MFERRIAEAMEENITPLLVGRTGVVNIYPPEGIDYDTFLRTLHLYRERLRALATVLAGDQLVRGSWPRWRQNLSEAMRRTWVPRFWNARLLMRVKQFMEERDVGGHLDVQHALDRLAHPAGAGVGDFWLGHIMAAFTRHRRVIITLRGMDGSHIHGLNHLAGHRLRADELLVNIADAKPPCNIQGEPDPDPFWREVKPDNPDISVVTVRMAPLLGITI